MADDEGTEWLQELLHDVQLTQFFTRIRDDLQVTRLHHFDYVQPEDLEKIGLGKPGIRRLLDAVKKRRNTQWKKNLITKIRPGSIDPMRKKQPEDISKPLENSFIHTGHGAPFGKSWGSPIYIDDVYLRNPMEPPDIVAVAGVTDNQKKKFSCGTPRSRKQFNYTKLQNDIRASPVKSSVPVPGTSQEGSLIDLSPEEISNTNSPQSDTTCRRVINILDEPIETVETITQEEPDQQEDPRTYANFPGNLDPTYSDPFDTSSVFMKPPHSRYYSHVPSDLTNHYNKTQSYGNIQNEESSSSSSQNINVNQYSTNLSKNSINESVNLNVNVNVSAEANAFVEDHYSEIDKLQNPSVSSWTSWPEDLQNDAQTYANVISHNLPTTSNGQPSPSPPPPPPLPPPPPPIGPNESPPKPKSNHDLAQNLSELNITSHNVASPKKLDSAFLAELEKHLGEKEASKNTNATQQHSNNESHTYTLINKLQDNSTIPTLRPPPQSIKPKSPQLDQRTSTHLPSKVQNSMQSKNTNIQKPIVQQEHRFVESTTDAIVGQMWQQAHSQVHLQSNYSVSTDPNVNRISPVVNMPQINVNLLQVAPSNLIHATSNLNSSQYGSKSATETTSTHAQNFTSTSQNYFQQQNIPLLTISRNHGITQIQNDLQQPQSSASNTNTISKPAMFTTGTMFSEQVYVELKQTVPNLEQLSQNEFNTLYNKTVQQNILRNYYASGATPTNTIVDQNLSHSHINYQDTASYNVQQQQQQQIQAAQGSRNTLQSHPCDFSPHLKQPPVYNPPPAWSPLKSVQNGFIRNQNAVMKSNLTANQGGNPNVLQSVHTKPHQVNSATSQTLPIRNVQSHMNETVINTQLAPSTSAYPSGVSPPLTGASQQLVMSLNDEFRATKVMRVQRDIENASQQEILAALQATGWDTAQAAKQIMKDRLVKIESLKRLGLADRQQCENALKQTDYDVERAASLLLDQAK
ncbi:hypothetical protein M0804_010646 [Polistes exclamans]|nr:hypothetical protein M0804_010646 [Polistes exclamans]